MEKPSTGDEPGTPAMDGRVLRLELSEAALMALLPQLDASMIVIRGAATIFCRGGRFPEMKDAGGHWCALEGGMRGLRWKKGRGFEVWWFEEQRGGSLLPCLEIADPLGRGLVKLCFRNAERAAEMEQLFSDHIAWEGDAWDMAHVRKCNLMDCAASRRFRDSPFGMALWAFFQEARQSGLRPGIVTHGGPLEAWELLPALRMQRNCCWVSAGHGGDFLHTEQANLRSATTHGNAIRFLGEDGREALTVIEPESRHAAAFEKLRRFITTAAVRNKQS